MTSRLGSPVFNADGEVISVPPALRQRLGA